MEFVDNWDWRNICKAFGQIQWNAEASTPWIASFVSQLHAVQVFSMSKGDLYEMECGRTRPLLFEEAVFPLRITSVVNHVNV